PPERCPVHRQDGADRQVVEPGVAQGTGTRVSPGPGEGGNPSGHGHRAVAERAGKRGVTLPHTEGLAYAYRDDGNRHLRGADFRVAAVWAAPGGRPGDAAGPGGRPGARLHAPV